MSELLHLRIRKDLNRWSRKLLVCIGLENIGKHLVGEEKWQSLYPAYSEQDGTPDFEPNEVPEPDAASADLSNPDPSETPDEEPSEDKNEFLENFFHLLPYWYFINRAFGGSGAGVGAGNNIAVDEDGSSRNPLLEAFDSQRLNSLLFLESLKRQLATQTENASGLENPFGQMQNLSLLSGNVFESAKKAAAGGLDSLPLTLPHLSAAIANNEDYDQPLDLTQKSKAIDEAREMRKHWPGVDNAEVSSSIRGLKLPESRVSKLSQQRPNPRSGKGYTTQELEAALRDIQSGKLGTRRAAVIYGIPRSTLRNKVYKMGRDRSRPFFRQKNVSERFGELEEPSRVDTSASFERGSYTSTPNPEEGASNQGLLKAANFRSYPNSHSQRGFDSHSRSEVGELDGDADGDPDADGDTDEDDGHKLEENEISHEKKMLKEWLRTKLSRQSPNSTADLIPVGTPTGMEAMSDSSDNSDDVTGQNLRQDVILKIPSLLNKSSLSRVISRNKLKRRASSEDTREEDLNNHSSHLKFCGMEPSSTAAKIYEGIDRGLWKTSKQDDGNDSDDCNLDRMSGSLIDHKDDPRNNSKDSKSLLSSMIASQGSLNAPSSSFSDTNGKKSRPKRGKYRNYDRDALLKAVRAVQNGEMSVHRAGSFYGVPHSTLEYKVKERHLLRRPKRKGGASSPKTRHKSSPESSMSGSDPPPSRLPSSASMCASGPSGSESKYLSFAPDLRDSLSQYLNLGQAMGMYQSPASPDLSSPSFRSPVKKIGNGSSDGKVRNDNSRHLSLNRGATNPFMNLFHLDDLIRNNLDNDSLLDLTKKP